jgi:hypothetical protein
MHVCSTGCVRRAALHDAYTTHKHTLMPMRTYTPQDIMRNRNNRPVKATPSFGTGYRKSRHLPQNGTFEGYKHAPYFPSLVKPPVTQTFFPWEAACLECSGSRVSGMFRKPGTLVDTNTFHCQIKVSNPFTLFRSDALCVGLARTAYIHRM